MFGAMAIEQMLTVETAAAALSVHPETIRRLIKRGQLQAIKIGKSYRIAESAIIAIQQPQKKEESGTE
jgi:excisionase family DNA binding protein